MTQTNEQKIKDALRTVGYLLETNGCIGSYAKRHDGAPVGPHHQSACRWCLSGAIHVVAPKFGVDVKDILASAHLRCVLIPVYGSSPAAMTRAWDTKADDRPKIIKALKEIQ